MAAQTAQIELRDGLRQMLAEVDAPPVGVTGVPDREQEWSSRLLDLKGAGLVPKFSGREAECEEFRSKVVSTMGLLDLAGLLDAAGKEKDPLDAGVMLPEVKAKGRFVYNLLVWISMERHWRYCGWFKRRMAGKLGAGWSRSMLLWFRRGPWLC